MTAEAQLVGGLLHDPRSLWKLGDIGPEDFERQDYGRIFATIVGRLKSGKPVDVVTVAEDLGEPGALADCGELARNVLSLANLPAHAELVREASRKRRMKLLLRDALSMVDTRPAAETAFQAIEELAQTARGTVTDSGWDDAETAAVTDIESAAEFARQGRALGVTSTLPSLDRAIGGYRGGRLYVLGGRPGRFKSVLAMQSWLQGGIDGHCVGLVSLEMGKSEIVSRAFANHYRLNLTSLLNGDPRTLASLNQLRREHPLKLRCRIDDRAKTLTQIRARLMEWKHVHDCKLAIVDHIQLVKTGNARRFDELAEISSTLKGLAMELDMPILVLSQIAREVEKEKRRPMASDLRECGNIEQDADVITFIHYDAAKNLYELLIAKNRGGPALTAAVPLVVKGEFQMVAEMAQ